MFTPGRFWRAAVERSRGEESNSPRTPIVRPEAPEIYMRESFKTYPGFVLTVVSSRNLNRADTIIDSSVQISPGESDEQVRCPADRACDRPAPGASQRASNHRGGDPDSVRKGCVEAVDL